jgi:nicotinamide phosphoribosyltransferase
LQVMEENGKYVLRDNVSRDEEAQSALKTVFKDGKLIREYTLSEIRERINSDQ